MSGPLIGRSAELAALDECLALVARRRFAAVELVGEPGIGKTRRWSTTCSPDEPKGVRPL